MSQLVVEVKSMSDEEFVLRTFVKHKLGMGRMIFGSEVDYKNQNPEHLVVSDATVVSLKRGKIWLGDLDVTIDEEKLIAVSRELGEHLYIIKEPRESFNSGTASADQLIKRAIWSTLVKN